MTGHSYWPIRRNSKGLEGSSREITCEDTAWCSGKTYVLLPVAFFLEVLQLLIKLQLLKIWLISIPIGHNYDHPVNISLVFGSLTPLYLLWPYRPMRTL